MSQVIRRGAVTPRMNITPLIDVVFLLIIFFMLVNNIVSEETVDMILPRVEEPETRPLGEVDRVVVNIAPQPFTRAGRAAFPLSHTGEAAYVKVGTGTGSRFEVGDLAGITAALRRAKAEQPEIEVLLRADGAVYYGQVQPIMGAVRAAGIETVNLVAYMPDEPGR
ncbi:MAG: biopolymer transporter ExbD [Planctomycetota bacterium]